MVLVVRDPPANAEDKKNLGPVPGLARSPGEEHGNISSILAWIIPGTEEPGRLQSIGSLKRLSISLSHC